MTTATPSAAVAQISAVVHASVELLCAAFQKRSSPAVMAAFAVVAGRYSDTELKKAVGWWIDNKSTMPSPAEIGKVCRKLKGAGVPDLKTRREVKRVKLPLHGLHDAWVAMPCAHAP